MKKQRQIRKTGFFQTRAIGQSEFIPYLALAAAVLAIYSNVFFNQFLFDDQSMLVQNKFLHGWENLPSLLSNSNFSGADRAGGFHRPLQMLLYFLIYQLFGLSLPAFHALNVGLHAVNAGLVYRLGRCFNLQRGLAFAAGLLWAVHPLHTEAVSYMSGTADPLFTMLCLLGLIVLLPDFTPRRMWFASALFIAALLSKESAIIFPALASISLFLTSKKRLQLATYYKTWPLWLLAFLYGTALFAFIQTGDFSMQDTQVAGYSDAYGHNVTNRILTFFATLPFYFSLIIWPSNLHMERSFDVFTTFDALPVLIGMAICVGILLQIVWGCARRGLAFSWGALWFLIALSPNTGIAFPIDALVYEHWMYLPTIGILLGFALVLSPWLKKMPKQVTIAVVLLAGVVAVVLAMKTYSQNEIWKNPVTFYENIFSSGENSGKAHNNLGIYYMNRGEFENAVEEYKKAIAHPMPLPQAEWPMLHTNLAAAYLGIRPAAVGVPSPDPIQALKRSLESSSHIPEAIDELKTALDLNPNLYLANKALAVIYAHEGDGEQAALYADRAAQLVRQ